VGGVGAVGSEDRGEEGVEEDALAVARLVEEEGVGGGSVWTTGGEEGLKWRGEMGGSGGGVRWGGSGRGSGDGCERRLGGGGGRGGRGGR
jgi:hypothetical protein